MLNIKNITFQVGSEILSGNTIRNTTDMDPSFLFLHGAGPAVSKARLRNLSTKLAEKGVASFSFDFSGHGESTGKLGESSLQKRLHESQAAYTYLNTQLPVTVCAFSMSGHIALKLLENKKIDNLILLAPAIYSKNAFTIPFNQGFTEIIRKPDSWKETNIIENIKSFEGNLLILIGKNDDVIPQGVVEMIYDNAIHTKKKELNIIPNIDHWFAKRTAENEEFANEISHKITNFLNN